MVVSDFQKTISCNKKNNFYGLIPHTRFSIHWALTYLHTGHKTI